MTGETAILRQQGDELAPATCADLQAGQLVAAAYRGPVAQTYPTQGTAGRIVISSNPSRVFGGRITVGSTEPSGEAW